MCSWAQESFIEVISTLSAVLRKITVTTPYIPKHPWFGQADFHGTQTCLLFHTKSHNSRRVLSLKKPLMNGNKTINQMMDRLAQPYSSIPLPLISKYFIEILYWQKKNLNILLVVASSRNLVQKNSWPISAKILDKIGTLAFKNSMLRNRHKRRRLKKARFTSPF